MFYSERQPDNNKNKVVGMQEIMSLLKILGTIVGALGFLVTFIAWFVKRTISQFDEKDKNLRDDITNLQITVAKSDKEIAVLQEGKIGRPELQKELTQVEVNFKNQLKELKEDLKEDLADIKDLIRRN